MGYMIPQGNDIYMFDGPLEVRANRSKHIYNGAENATTPEEDHKYREDLFNAVLDGLKATRKTEFELKPSRIYQEQQTHEIELFLRSIAKQRKNFATE